MDYVTIQQKLDYGRGKEAQVLGPPYDVYRMNSQDSDGNVLISANQIATSVKVRCKVAYGASIRTSLESEKNQGIIWYEICADMSPFLVGDIFVLNDPVYGQGYSSVNFETDEFKGFALADHSPMKKSLGGRLNCTVQILRPSLLPNSSGQWDRATNFLPVTLTAGVFELGQVNTIPANIPAGLVALGRSYGSQAFMHVPAEQRKSGWELYMPALNGFNIREGDRIIGTDGAKYIVIIPYTQYVGTTGAQWFLEREAAGE